MTVSRTSTGSLPPKGALPYLQRTPSMANPTFEVGREPLVLSTAEAYPENKYSQQEFLEALLKRYPMDVEGQEFAERIFPATGILQGNSALPRDQLFRHMTRQEFVEYIRITTVSTA
jgi:hypothetical protein